MKTHVREGREHEEGEGTRRRGGNTKKGRAHVREGRGARRRANVRERWGARRRANVREGRGARSRAHGREGTRRRAHARDGPCLCMRLSTGRSAARQVVRQKRLECWTPR